MPKKPTKKKEKEKHSKDSEKGKIENKKKEKSKKITQTEFEKQVLKLAKTGLTSEKIGEQLRQQNIHPKDFKKKISKILKENNAYIDPNLKNIEEKLNAIKKHYEKNKQDKRAKREVDRIAAQLRKLKIYHKVPLK